MLTPSQTEATPLPGIKVTDTSSSEATAKVLLATGGPVAVVKLGGQGAYYVSGSASGIVPAFRVAAIDTVAAGDAFGTALAVALSEGNSLPDTVR